MRVRVKERGYWDQIREPGEEFEVPDDTKPATWFEPIDKPKRRTAGPKPEGEGGQGGGDQSDNLA